MNILKSLHKYVPFCEVDEKKCYGEQGIVGDQLSVERAVNGHVSLANGFTAEERLEGLHFEVADWHAGNKFLEVRYFVLINIHVQTYLTAVLIGGLLHKIMIQKQLNFKTNRNENINIKFELI